VQRATLQFIQCTAGILYLHNDFFTSLAGAVVKYYHEYVCLWVCLCVCLSVCLSARISPGLHARSLPFLCMLSMSVARSSFGMLTIGRIAYRRDGVFFPTDNALYTEKEGWEYTARAKYI